MNESAHAKVVGCNQQNVFSVKADAKEKRSQRAGLVGRHTDSKKKINTLKVLQHMTGEGAARSEGVFSFGLFWFSVVNVVVDGVEVLELLIE